MHSHLWNGAAKGALTKLVDKETEVLAARRMKRLGRQINQGTIATMVVILVMAVPLVAGLWVLGGQSAAPVWVSVGLRIDDADPTLPEWFSGWSMLGVIRCSRSRISVTSSSAVSYRERRSSQASMWQAMAATMSRGTRPRNPPKITAGS